MDSLAELECDLSRLSASSDVSRWYVCVFNSLGVYVEIWPLNGNLTLLALNGSLTLLTL